MGSYASEADIFPSCLSSQQNSNCEQKYSASELEGIEKIPETYMFFEEVKKRAMLNAQVSKMIAENEMACFQNAESNTNCTKIIAETKSKIDELLPILRMAMSLVDVERRVEKVLPGSPVKEKARVNIKHLAHGLPSQQALTDDEIGLVSDFRAKEELAWIEEFKHTAEAEGIIKNRERQIRNILHKFSANRNKERQLSRARDFWKIEYFMAQNRFLARKRKYRSIHDLKEYREVYFSVLNEYPLLAYLKSANPTDHEIINAYRELGNNSSKVIKRLEKMDPLEFDKNLELMFHTQIMNDILKEKPHLCSLATTLRQQFERKRYLGAITKDLAVGATSLSCWMFVKVPQACIPLVGAGYLLLGGHYALKYNAEAQAILSHVNEEHGQTLTHTDLDYNETLAKINIFFSATPLMYKEIGYARRVATSGFKKLYMHLRQVGKLKALN